MNESETPAVDEPGKHLAPIPAKSLSSTRVLRLYLINPSNPLASIVDMDESRWNHCRVWKPLGLMVIAGLTPESWDITILDENLGVPDYSTMPRPDLVGITAFTSQADRAYVLADRFRSEGVPVVLGGIHATMCRDEASRYADAIVTGEAESVWGKVLDDVRHHRLKPLYEGGFANIADLPPARHDLLAGPYVFGSIQTSRGCPLHCSFCSVTSFNGAKYRQRPIDQIMSELRSIPEDLILIVDDNLVGTRRKDVERAKELFRAMIQAGLKKKWVAQTTINVANDDELLELAAEAGCKGLFIGFESPKPEGLKGVSGKGSLCKCTDLGEAVRRIQRHGILVAGSFIIGLDGDRPGIGKLIADTAERYGVDLINVLFLTPLPGTRLWDELEAQGRIVMNDYPEDWSYFTLTYPVARYRGLTMNEATAEMTCCSRRFYSVPKMLRRLWRNLWRGQSVLIGLAAWLSYRSNIKVDCGKLAEFESRCKLKLPVDEDVEGASAPMGAALGHVNR